MPLTPSQMSDMMETRAAWFMALPCIVDLVVSLDDERAWAMVYRLFRCGYALGLEDYAERDELPDPTATDQGDNPCPTS